MLSRDNLLPIFAFGLMLILTFWMQFVLLEDPKEKTVTKNNDPDYYIENFTAYGIDGDGKQYQLEADRLVHYPVDDKALLDRPHLIQLLAEGGPTHIYADSGWLFSDGSELLLSKNVKVIRSQGGLPGGGATTNRMRIKLKPKKE